MCACFLKFDCESCTCKCHALKDHFMCDDCGIMSDFQVMDPTTLKLVCTDCALAITTNIPTAGELIRVDFKAKRRIA